MSSVWFLARHGTTVSVISRWCHLLSNKPDTRVILIFSDMEAEYMHLGHENRGKVDGQQLQAPSHDMPMIRSLLVKPYKED